MTRLSTNEIDKEGKIINGYDYDKQCWVVGGIIQDCGHPRKGEYAPAIGRAWGGCNCYGRIHKGEAIK